MTVERSHCPDCDLKRNARQCALARRLVGVEMTHSSNAPLQLRASAPVSCKHQLDRASAPEAFQCGLH